MTSSMDHLRLQGNKHVRKSLSYFSADNEVALYSGPFEILHSTSNKLLQWALDRTRVLLITDSAVYDLYKCNFKCKRRIPLACVTKITRSYVCNHFILSIAEEDDHVYSSRHVPEICQTIQAAQQTLLGYCSAVVFRSATDLRSFAVSMKSEAKKLPRAYPERMGGEDDDFPTLNTTRRAEVLRRPPDLTPDPLNINESHTEKESDTAGALTASSSTPVATLEPVSIFETWSHTVDIETVGLTIESSSCTTVSATEVPSNTPSTPRESWSQPSDSIPHTLATESCSQPSDSIPHTLATESCSQPSDNMPHTPRESWSQPLDNMPRVPRESWSQPSDSIPRTRHESWSQPSDNVPRTRRESWSHTEFKDDHTVEFIATTSAPVVATELGSMPRTQARESWSTQTQEEETVGVTEDSTAHIAATNPAGMPDHPCESWSLLQEALESVEGNAASCSSTATEESSIPDTPHTTQSNSGKSLLERLIK